MSKWDYYNPTFDDGSYENDIISKIKYAKTLYEAQVWKVEKEEYVKKLLLEDYAKQIRAHRSRYDLVGIFSEAQKEIGAKLKKDRPNLETIKRFIMKDFLNNDKNFKLTEIISLGYECYGWQIEFKGYGKRIAIEIPMVSRITAENIKCANYGMFTFGIWESDHCLQILKRSYKIGEISETIKKHFCMTDTEKQEE